MAATALSERYASNLHSVLSANYPDAVDPMGVLEVVGEGITSRNGAWALAVGAEIVKARRTR